MLNAIATDNGQTGVEPQIRTGQSWSRRDLINKPSGWHRLGSDHRVGSRNAHGNGEAKGKRVRFVELPFK
jgi:hypothetical protein